MQFEQHQQPPPPQWRGVFYWKTRKIISCTRPRGIEELPEQAYKTVVMKRILSISSSYAGLATVLALLVGLASCRPDAKEPRDGQPESTAKNRSSGDKKMAIEVTSTAFQQGHAIPKKYTGEGADVSPSLAWTGISEGAKELVLICDDPDAPTEEPWVHWVIYKIPADTKGLPEGVPRKLRLKEPQGAIQGHNSWPAADAVGYRGPMPPPGHGVHHYYFKLYAIKAHMVVEPGMNKKAILEEIHDHILDQGTLMGTYQR
jgi:Raf kinase inhibitor-like YbhB/YbcL family protein